MKKKILFIVDWPEKLENSRVLQKLLDSEYSKNYEWKVWSCKKKENNNILYRWISYLKGALYIIINRKKYDAFFIWQQMVGYSLFEILKLFPLKIYNIILFTFIYNSNTIFRKYKKQMVKNGFKHSKALIWPSLNMKNEVDMDFPKFLFKNYHFLMPIFDIVNINIPVAEELDDPYFRNGVYSAGKSERDFDTVIRAFRNTDIPVTIVCTDKEVISETNISANIRILRFSQVSHEQYYALLGQAFCVLMSLVNTKSPCGNLTISVAMSNSIPIIATDAYGVQDYIINNENGILFELGDSDAILQGYRKLRDNPHFKNYIVQNAKNTVKKMSSNKFIEKIIEIVEN